MSDVKFRTAFMPNTYADRVQRMAVLFPLTKLCHKTPEVQRQTERLVSIWRARVSSLSTFGWQPRPGHHSTLYARNCCPSFVYTTPRMRPCNNRSLCPFCYARWVRSVWQAVDAGFPHGIEPDARDVPIDSEERLTLVPTPEPMPATFRYHLIERHQISWLPYESPRDPSLTQLVWAQSLLRSLATNRGAFIKRVSPLGAFVWTTMEPTDRGWRIKHRQLFKVEAGYRLPDDLAATAVSLRYHEQPTRRVVFEAVARACRYPVKLIRGDAERTALLLRAKQEVRVRMSAFYRGFRGVEYE